MFEPNIRIYDKKWDTPENLKYKKKVMNKLLLKSPLYPTIPASWAKEIYNLLELWESQHGISYPKTACYKSMNLTFIGRLKRTFYNIKHLIKNPKKRNLQDVLNDFKAIAYLSFRLTIGQLINKYSKPRPSLNIIQVKEKWGTLRVYFDMSLF